MKLKLGDAVVVKLSTPFNGSYEQPAIVNHVWGTGDTTVAPQCVNAMVLPDCGMPFSMTSVLIHDAKPADLAVNDSNVGWLPAA